MNQLLIKHVDCGREMSKETHKVLIEKQFNIVDFWFFYSFFVCLFVFGFWFFIVVVVVFYFNYYESKKSKNWRTIPNNVVN